MKFTTYEGQMTKRRSTDFTCVIYRISQVCASSTTNWC